MRAWYDIYEMSIDRKVDMVNIDESCEQIEALIADQVSQGIAPERIVLAGFSQGGVIAYQLALKTKFTLAGVMALSTYLVNRDKLPSAENCVNGKTPVLIHHGSQDPVVVPSLAIQARDALLAQGYQVQYQCYDMPHAVCPDQVSDISNWLNARFV